MILFKLAEHTPNYGDAVDIWEVGPDIPQFLGTIYPDGADGIRVCEFIQGSIRVVQGEKR